MNAAKESGFDEGCRAIIAALNAAAGTVERDRARARAALDRLVSSGSLSGEELTSLSVHVDKTMEDVKRNLDAAALAIGVLPAVLARSRRVLDATAQRMDELVSADTAR